MPEIQEGDDSTSDQWNTFISNMMLLKQGNTAYVQTAGTEANVNFVASPGNLTMDVPHLSLELEWNGHPIMLVYQLNWWEYNNKDNFTFYLVNDFNGEYVELPVTSYLPSGEGYCASGGMQLLEYTTKPTEPTTTTFKVQCVASVGNDTQRAFIYPGKPGLLMWELPL